MRFTYACLSILFSISAFESAYAGPINLVQNGDFSQIHQVTGGLAVNSGTPTQLNYAPSTFNNAPNEKSYGEFVND
ncbi:hypothetical protein [Candidatus Nitrosacidococcus sp. I8]|uniref:hypothetical protein n=1 Tax=Candidatus Nitrosacidococcus sp. I8 TaxID=2942908 RepID=UPI0022274C32|nr:hypothetical protein [Candidatus Nitrosacidococcus sp. I8]CAH9019130.1 hypothetical protein NURINAE_01348 [Candidatus Nitrosacidococcus sp. I8]